MFCSQSHADEFVQKVQAARIQAAVSAPTQWDWKRYVKLGICIGAPLLALLVLAGGGSAVLGAAGTLLPVLAFLACPLAMYFLMRSMTKTDQSEKREGKGEET